MRFGGSEVTRYEVIMNAGGGQKRIGFSRLGRNGLLSLIRNSELAQSAVKHISDDCPLYIKGGNKKTVITVSDVSFFFSGKTEKDSR
jgi:hypothetical protein